ncbi:MAG: MATE family efflux transporter [bacterium]|nr:MATE family efflux transporter [bacterium]
MKHKFDEIPIKKLVLQLGLPAMLAQFFNILYSIVDRMFVGNIAGYGDLALASIGISAPALTAITAFAYLICIGGSSYMSISLGKKEPEMANKAISQSFMMLLLVSIVVTIGCLVFKKPLLYALGCSDTMYPYANSYFSIYVLGTFASLLSLGMNFFVLAQGHARHGMISIALGAVVNLILDPIFIYGFGLGIAGAAAATVLSQICAMIYVLRFLFSASNPIRITLGKLDWSILKKTLTIGMMPFIIMLVDNLIVIFLNASLRMYGGDALGDVYISAAAIVQSFMVLIVCPLQGITNGCSTLYSYHYGAGNYKKVMEAFRYVLLLCACYVVLLMVAAQAFPSVFVRLFTRDAQMIVLCTGFIRKYTIGLLGVAVQFAVVDGLTAMGKVRFTLPVSFLRKIIFLLCIWILPMVTSLDNIFYCETISDLLGATFTSVLFLCVIRHKLKRELTA